MNLIDSIYTSVVNKLIEDVPKEEQDELKKYYYKHLEEKYSEEEKEENLQNCIEMELIELNELDKNAKESFYVFDEVFYEIGKISNMAFNLAKAKKEESKTEVNPDKIKLLKEKLIQLLPEVRPFNKEIAQDYVSEGLLDFDYAMDISENMSIRLGYLLK